MWSQWLRLPGNSRQTSSHASSPRSSYYTLFQFRTRLVDWPSSHEHPLRRIHVHACLFVCGSQPYAIDPAAYLCGTDPGSSEHCLPQTAHDRCTHSKYDKPTDREHLRGDSTPSICNSLAAPHFELHVYIVGYWTGDPKNRKARNKYLQILATIALIVHVQRTCASTSQDHALAADHVLWKTIQACLRGCYRAQGDPTAIPQRQMCQRVRAQDRPAWRVTACRDPCRCI